MENLYHRKGERKEESEKDNAERGDRGYICPAVRTLDPAALASSHAF